MQPKLLEILSCPHCAGNIELDETLEGEGTEVRRGVLRCAGCAVRFPVVHGVPQMLPSEHARTVESAFSEQWEMRAEGAFEDRSSMYGRALEARADTVEQHIEAALKRAAAEPGQVWVVDAGSGPGELLAAVAKRHPEVQFVGLDFQAGDLRPPAARGLANVHFVRGDVNRPPLRHGAASAVYSIGVLHHTADTRRAFESVAGLVAPGGLLHVWLYPHIADVRSKHPEELRFYQTYYGVRDYLFLGRGHRVPPGLRLHLLRLTCLPVLARASERSRLDAYHAAVFLLFDDLAPEYQHRHAITEVDGWYRSNAFTDVCAWDRRLGNFVGRKRADASASAS